jgi:hypothetical protein
MTTSTQIMNDMDRTRDEIRTTLSAITERASVERVIQQYVVPTREGAAEFGRAFADAVRANPIPLGLTALGLGWLMLGQRSRPVEAIIYDGPSGGGIGDEDVAPGEGIGSRVEERLRRAGERADETRRRVGETVEEAKRRAGERVEKAKESARHLAEETVGRVRDAAGRGRQWTAHTAGRASDTIRHSVETASEVGGRVRHAARRPVGYAREHPLALGAVLVIGGAALALLLARRPTVVLEEEDLAPAGMPETPYASGTQAEMSGLHRNPTEPLTPEDEEPVFAAGDVSEAAHPATGTTEAEREVVATTPSTAEDPRAVEERAK